MLCVAICDISKHTLVSFTNFCKNIEYEIRNRHLYDKFTFLNFRILEFGFKNNFKLNLFKKLNRVSGNALLKIRP